MRIDEFIRESCITKDFPKKGVEFVDIFPILRKTNLEGFRERFQITEPVVFIPEARGFLFMDAVGFNKCVPIRKFGKLPGRLCSYYSTKEYGKDNLYFQKDTLLEIAKINDPNNTHHEVVFVDDVLATGQTAESFKRFIESMSFDGHTFKVTRCCFFLELTDLKGRDLITTKVESLYEY